MQQTNSNVPLPKTPEELEKFRQEYPDVYDVMGDYSFRESQSTSSRTS